MTDKVRLFKLFKKFLNFLWLKLDSHADTGQLSRDYQIIYSLLYYTIILLIMSITVFFHANVFIQDTLLVIQRVHHMEMIYDI